MAKKLSSLITAAVFAVFMIISSFTVVYADNYKNWLQSDSRWSGKTLGGSGETMREIGCAVTSVAIQVVHSGSRSENNFNPGTLVDYLNKSGGLDSGGNLYWGAVTGLVSNFTFEKRAYFASQTKTNIIKELTNYINSGYYVVMSVDYDCHWVAVDTISNGVVYMMDPAQNKTNKLFDYYNVGGMLQVRLFKGKNAPAKVNGGSNSTPGTPSTTQPATTTAPANTYLTGHYLTTDPLNLRASYSTSSDVLLTIPENSTIIVTRIYNNSWGETEYDGKTGWVYLGYTKYTESSYTYNTGTYKCTSDTGVNMRSGIGTDKSVVCLIPYKAQVTISSVSHNWGKATYGSYTGYICMDYLEYVSDGTTATTKPAESTTTTAKVTTTTTAATTTTTAATTTTTAATTTTTAATTTTTAATTTTAKTTTTTTAATTTTAKTTTTATAATTTTAKATTAAATTSNAVITNVSTTTASSVSAPAATAPIIKGDINKDGKLDKDDVLKLNLYIINPVKLDVLAKYIYDVNNDGIINEIDVVYLMKAIKKQLYLTTK